MRFMSKLSRQVILVLLVGGLAFWPTNCGSPTKQLPNGSEFLMFTYFGSHAFESSIMIAHPDGSHITTLLPAQSTVGYEAGYGNSLSQYVLVYFAELGAAGTQVNKLQIYRPLLDRFESIPLPPGDAGPATPSPDGTMYATVASPLDFLWEGRIWVVKLSTGAVTQLTQYDGLSYQDSSPVWSPDGQWIAFLRLDLSQAPNYHINVYRVRPDGTELTPLTPGDEFINAIGYAPDGQLMLTSRNGIELLNPSTQQRTVVLSNTMFPTTTYQLQGAGIGWSRTQGTIVWPMFNKSLNRHEMWSVNPDGSDFRMLFRADPSVWMMSQMSVVAR